jgi:23S rRNA (adenine2030-N6)-methyltransferase
MNYRHHYHAGNFADVMKHVLLLQLVRGLQRKEKGFLYLDTHAGRGAYDLSIAERGDTLARTPEHPDGIGRLLAADGLSNPLSEYVESVKAFDARTRRELGRPGEELATEQAGGIRFYPGSPRLVQRVTRLQDRLALCEKHPDEFVALRAEFAIDRGVSVHELDGYTAIRAMLPPLEKRALVLIDPPFEEKNEFAQIVNALREGLRRLPGATFAVWYPLTERARADDFLADLQALRPPPSWTAELTIAGEHAPMKMKGCGLAVVNPPWQIDREISPVLTQLAARLEQAPGGQARLRWLVEE